MKNEHYPPHLSRVAGSIYMTLRGLPEGLTRDELKIRFREEFARTSGQEIDQGLNELLGKSPKHRKQYIGASQGRFFLWEVVRGVSLREELLAFLPESCCEEGSNLHTITTAMAKKGFAREGVIRALEVLCSTNEAKHTPGAIFTLPPPIVSASRQEGARS
jgi:hypothetical protein